MARCEVVQVQCDRCKRVELRAPTPKKTEPELLLTYKGRTVKYEDLCTSCGETVENLIKRIEEWERVIKQQFGPTIDPNHAPQIAVAPNYTPLQPHAAGAKK